MSPSPFWNRTPEREKAATLIATWFGCGFVPVAPGTAGTVGALPLYLAMAPLGPGAVVAAAAGVAALGVWVSSAVVRRLAVTDPQIVCIDEVAGVLLTLAASPGGWRGLLLGFVLFRIFDTIKPWPARRWERLALGWGVVMDDLAAGLWGAAVLLAVRLAGWLP